MNEIISNLKDILSESVKRNSYKGLLFSGGLDTSILASLNPKAIGITVSLGSEAEDIRYSKLLASLLDMRCHHKAVDIDEAIEAIPEVIKILKSFDPAIPNDLVVYFGLKLAKELGIEIIATGDGSDELFGGYSFMRKIDDLDSYIKMISQSMSFSSNNMGEFFGIRIIQPFINKRVIDFALQVPTDLKIRTYNGKTWGKWILRKAFEEVLPMEIIWQGKRALEIGSGMAKIREIISSRVTDEEFKEGIHPVKLANKEHFYYYKVYKNIVGDIPKPNQGEKKCSGCGAGMRPLAFHCKVCGYTFDWRL